MIKESQRRLWVKSFFNKNIPYIKNIDVRMYQDGSAEIIECEFPKPNMPFHEI